MEVDDFFRALFNYIFPIDYLVELRLKLDRARQRDKSVNEYVHELTELFNMIGTVSERDKVNKFWISCNPTIRQGLWRDSLNPNLSSWNDVVTQAEIIEISENVYKSKDHASKTSTHQGSDSVGQGGGSKFRSCSKNHHGNSAPHRSGTPSTSGQTAGSSRNSARPNTSQNWGHSKISGGNDQGKSRFNSRGPSNSTAASQSTPKLSDKELAW